MRELTPAPFGVNVFVLEDVPSTTRRSPPIETSLAGEAARYEVELGEPHFDDDGLDAKVGSCSRTACRGRLDTFGCPSAELVRRLHAAGTAVWVTIGSPAEVAAAVAAGADALVVQGTEAGGHRGGLRRLERPRAIPLLRLVARDDWTFHSSRRAESATARPWPRPRSRRGGGAGRHRVSADARGGDESTAPAALAGDGGETAITRAFTGRRARGSSTSSCARTPTRRRAIRTSIT